MTARPPLSLCVGQIVHGPWAFNSTHHFAPFRDETEASIRRALAAVTAPLAPGLPAMVSWRQPKEYQQLRQEINKKYTSLSNLGEPAWYQQLVEPLSLKLAAFP